MENMGLCLNIKAREMCGQLPVCGMCCAHGDDVGAADDLVDGGAGVGQVGHVRHGWQPVWADHLLQLGLHTGLHLRVVQHVQHAPLQGRLQRLHAGREEVQHDLVELGARVLAAGKQLLGGGGARLDLQQVGVHEVARRLGVQGGLVVSDNLLDKAEHLLAVAAQLVTDRPHAGQMAQNGQEEQGAGLSEEAESFVEQVHETAKLRVVRQETGGHGDAADDVANEAVEDGGGVELAAGGHNGGEEGLDLVHDTGLHLLAGVAPVLEAELLLVQETALGRPEAALGGDDA